MKNWSWIGLGVVGVMTVGSWGYYQWQQSRFWCEGCVRSYRLNRAKKPKLKGSNYIITYRDATFILPKKQMDKGLFSRLEEGMVLEVVGKREPTATTPWRREISLIKLAIVDEQTSLPGGVGMWKRLERKLARWRERAFVRVRGYYGEPEASLITGLTLGRIDGMPGDFYEALVKTGTLHVVAASGTNVMLVLGGLMMVGVMVFPRRVVLGAGLAGIVGYVLLAGAEPPVVRAALMGGLVVLAEVAGRAYSAAWALVVVALLMVLVFPWILVSLSFQLSVAATAGIVWGNKPVEDWWRRIMKRLPLPEKGISFLSSELALPSAALLSTLPVSLATFGSVPVLSLVANVLIGWMIVPLTLLGALVILLSSLWEPAGWAISWVSQPLLRFLIGVVEGLGKFDWGMMSMEQWSWWFGLGWWLLLIAWWSRGYGRRD